MGNTVWMLLCNDQEQPPYKSFDVLAVARTREGIDAFMRRYLCSDDYEIHTNEHGEIVERTQEEDGWSEWAYPSLFDSPFVYSLAEMPFEEDLPDDE